MRVVESYIRNEFNLLSPKPRKYFSYKEGYDDATVAKEVSGYIGRDVTEDDVIDIRTGSGLHFEPTYAAPQELVERLQLALVETAKIQDLERRVGVLEYWYNRIAVR